MKIEPLKCPQCGSAEVKMGFTKRIRSAFVSDGKIWCYSCNKVTNTKTGQFEKHNYSINKIEELEQS